MADQEQNTTFRTKELSLATVLNMRGFCHQTIERRDKRTAIWVFDRSDSLMEIVDEFMGNECLVEPKEFMREASGVRNEMYRVLGKAA